MHLVYGFDEKRRKNIKHLVVSHLFVGFFFVFFLID